MNALSYFRSRGFKDWADCYKQISLEGAPEVFNKIVIDPSKDLSKQVIERPGLFVDSFRSHSANYSKSANIPQNVLNKASVHWKEINDNFYSSYVKK